MNLNYRQQHQLRRIEAGLRRADPHLGAMFGIFGRLYPHQDMPVGEQQPRVPSSRNRIPRAVRWIFAAPAAAIGVLLSKAVIAVVPTTKATEVRACSRAELTTGEQARDDSAPER
ncbi:MAG TPA: hypothetical protein VJ305_12330 [Streptosporangiaceae bacterium]|nr:hypothetical protein [Streptosporangiaceae bacterium]